MDLDDTNVQFLVHFKKYGRTILQIREYSQLILSTYEWLITKEHTHKTFIGEKEEELAGCIILEALKEVQMELEQYGQKIEILNKKLQNMFKNSSPYDYLQNFIPDVVDKTDPPIKVKNRKYNPKLSGTVSIVIPEFPTLLIIFISTDIKFKSLAK